MGRQKTADVISKMKYGIQPIELVPIFGLEVTSYHLQGSYPTNKAKIALALF